MFKYYEWNTIIGNNIRWFISTGQNKLNNEFVFKSVFWKKGDESLVRFLKESPTKLLGIKIKPFTSDSCLLSISDRTFSVSICVSVSVSVSLSVSA